MEGFTGCIVNKSGQSYHIFKRKLPAGHKVFLAEVWPIYADKVKSELDKRLVSEGEFVEWLNAHGHMKDGFEYHSGDQSVLEPGPIAEATSPDVDMDEVGSFADGRFGRTSLANAPQGIVDRLTYTDIANLRTTDLPEKIINVVTNIHKLRRAYTLVRRMPRKRRLERILHSRIQDLERLV